MKILNAKVVASKKDLSLDEWRNLRRTGIGGSDAASIVGMNPYQSAFALCGNKLGHVPDPEDNEAMRLGRDLEPYVADRFLSYMEKQKTPKIVRNCNFVLQHPKYPFMHANIDRLIVGERAGLECKTTSVMNLKQYKNGEFPERYYAQCVHYLAVTGADRWYLHVLILNEGERCFVIERDENEISALIAKEAEFWNMMQRGEYPPADWSESTQKALNIVYSDADNDDLIYLHNYDAVTNLANLKELKKETENQITHWENVIKAEMKHCGRMECGDYKATWLPQSKTSFDFDTFQSDFPDIDLSPYRRSSTTRVFRFSQITRKEA